MTKKRRRSMLAATLSGLFLAVTTVSYTFSNQATVIKVAPGGDLQAAINAAQPGDTIILEAGAVYMGPIMLPDKPGAGYITIQSSRAGELPEGVRVSPAQRPLMASVQSAINGDAIITTAPGAHHFKLIGIEVSTTSSSVVIFDLVRLGDSAQTTLAVVPHHFVIDRSYLHGFQTQEVQRGVSLNSAETEIRNSYISDVHGRGYDTQAICGWNGPGPYKIINNYLEGSGENVMFGGALAAIPGLIPSDIEIRNNHFFKPLTWKESHPSYAGIHWTVKNLFELKNARNVIIDGNTFENSWTDAQVGYGIVITVRGEGSNQMPWATIQNVTFSNNIVRNCDQGIQTLGLDYLNASTRASGLRVYNNRFEGIQNWFFVLNGFYNTTIEHNTHAQGGNILMLTGDPSQNFVYKNNATTRDPHGFGVFGDGKGEGKVALETYAPGYVFAGNVIAGAAPSIYPEGNFFPADLSGLSGFKGTDGLVPGFTEGAASPSPAPTATPVPSPSPTPVVSPSPTASPTPIPSPSPTPSLCQLTAPAEVSIRKNGAGVINVQLNNTQGPTTVQVIGSNGQVAVTPLSKTVTGSSALIPFGVRVKKQSRPITFSSPCGSATVSVLVN